MNTQQITVHVRNLDQMSAPTKAAVTKLVGLAIKARKEGKLHHASDPFSPQRL